MLKSRQKSSVTQMGLRMRCFMFTLYIGFLFSFEIDLNEEPNSEDEVIHITTRELQLLQRAAGNVADWSTVANYAKEGILKCKKKDEPCGGLVPCCGSNQCYWKNGYSLIKKGVCVECVQQGQLCQRDVQCCDGLVCQKNRVFHINGICDVKRPTGSLCHDTDQCVSNRCNFTGWQWARLQEGRCL